MKKKSTGQSGSALIIILVAVALFGALSYTVANMLRGGDSPNAIAEQPASILTDEILGYARTVKQAVQDLKISNGCEDEQISFENDIGSEYVNTAAPNDCRVYGSEGANLSRQNMFEDVSSSPWLFTGENRIANVGSNTTDGDLLIVLPDINLTVCLAINDKLNVPNASQDTPVSNVYDPTKFTGTYASTQIIGDGLEIAGFQAGCAESSGEYYFYSTLIAR